LAEINALRQQIASANAHSIVGVNILDQVRGARRGEAVTLVQKQSDMSDIQEEIGNAVGKLADKRVLGQKNVRLGGGVNKEALNRIAAYYERLPDAPHEDKLRDLVKMLQTFEDLMKGEGGKGGKSASADDILRALSETDGDARRQYMLLQGARVHFEKKEGSEAMVALLDRAERSFNDSGVAYDVRADYAMLVHAKTAGPSLGLDPGALRDKYREMLLSSMDLGKLFYSLSDFYKRLNFHAVVDLFLKAAGDDLATISTKTDHSFLAGLLKELTTLKTLRTVFEASAEMLEKTRRIFPRFGNRDGKNKKKKKAWTLVEDDEEGEKEEQGLVGEKALMGELLAFCAKQTPGLDDGRRIIKPYEDDETSPKARVIFYNGLLDLHRQIPDQVFPAAQARLRQVGVLSEMCGTLAEAEEQAYRDENS